MGSKKIQLIKFLLRIITRIEILAIKGSLPENSRDINVYGRVVIENPCNVHIGCGTTLNEGVYISGHDSVTIGKFVSLSAGAKIITAYLSPEKILDKDKTDIHQSKPVTIGDYSQIGAGAIVLPGVRIGTGVIVAAGAVVTKDIEDGVIVAGVPAKVIRDIKCH
ncbi:DapH/DapD/GlmU-related protein [Aeromonas caviae]|uniref:acyltransferase n=1 Tax=Aeromonas caviae TaxID=648 RepID=UPI002B4599F4|nr:DapH/DapD/GlmU-related protein [Aeromonas caviae]